MWLGFLVGEWDAKDFESETRGIVGSGGDGRGMWEWRNGGFEE